MSPDRQISESTIGQYRAMATPYRDGTWDHDVSQNVQALLAAIAGPPPIASSISAAALGAIFWPSAILVTRSSGSTAPRSSWPWLARCPAARSGNKTCWP